MSVHQSLLDTVPEGIVSVDGEGRVNGWNTAAEQLLGVQREAILGRPILDLVPYEFPAGDDTDVRSALDRGEIWTGTATVPGAAGGVLQLRIRVAPLEGVDSQHGYIVVMHDTATEPRLGSGAEVAEARFKDFVAAGPGLAFIKDGEGRYLFANDNALRLMGERSAADWQGRTDEDLWPPEVAAQIRNGDDTALARAAPTEVELSMLAADGIHTILLSTFPLRGASGEALVGSIGVDITDRVRRETEARNGTQRPAPDALHALERAAVADALVRLRGVMGIDETAYAICLAIHALPRLALASIVFFEVNETGTPIGVSAAVGPPRPLPRLPKVHTRRLRLRAADGPWVEPWAAPSRHPHNRAMRALGIEHVAYAPIHSGEDMIGVLMAGASPDIGGEELVGMLPAITEFAGLAGALLAPGMPGRLGYRNARGRILNVIRRRSFRPVFQPIVDLVSGIAIGYEALTRFDDGVDPGVRFAEAATVDLGLELELATLKAVLRDAAGLPAHAWLSINISPRLVMSGRPLRSLLGRHRGELVCEVTEHEAIDDYPAFRTMTARLPGVRLAIDDVGAGFASFRHILELRPAFVKLDRSLVAGIDADPIRRELIASMGTFMQAVNCRLIAEGIETEAEKAALVQLGVPLGQGYLLGRPGAPWSPTMDERVGQTPVMPDEATERVQPSQSPWPAEPAC